MRKRFCTFILSVMVVLITVVPYLHPGLDAYAAGDDSGLTVVFHFTKEDNNYDNYYMWIWFDGDGTDVPMVAGDNEATMTLDSQSTPALSADVTAVNYIVKDGPGWDGVTKDVEDDRSIDVSAYSGGTLNVYLQSQEADAEIDDSEAVTGVKVTSASTDDYQTINIKTGAVLDDDLKGYFQVIDDSTSKEVEQKSIEEDGDKPSYVITLADEMNKLGSYTLKYGNGLTFQIDMPDVYSTDEFESEYTYDGDDLGAVWSKDKTVFKVWAPVATEVSVNLYKSGDEGADDLIESVPMTADANGTWTAEKSGDLNGVYYTYEAVVRGQKVETIDPYARTAGVNGKRGMIIDLSSTDPDGWDSDTNPNSGNNYEDDVIYELHVRDFSIDDSSGMKNKGKYLAFTETGTVNSNGDSTGIDYLKELGVTHVHLLPVYDYGSVDESKLDEDQFNWGYDPVNYNLPEGSYSTDPSDGAVRVKEFKKMIQALHEAGISVVMDVVYGHVYNADTFSINELTPGYYSRPNSNGSGCGNDTATERSMNRKFIVDSMKYWAEEYHIDGFRIDQVGLFDTDTVNEITTELHQIDPSMLLYGEGWEMTTNTTKDVTLANQKAASETPGFAYFNDTIRDGIKGGVFDTDAGYVTRNYAKVNYLVKSMRGEVAWAASPDQSINYASCHDNYTLFDRLAISNSSDSEEQRVAENKLAAAIIYTSQGVPFMQAGEEILRTKVIADTGEFDGNSYNAPSSENSIKWDTLSDDEYKGTYNYYKGLIAFRKAHPALRMTSDDEIDQHMSLVQDGSDDGLVEYQISGSANGDSEENIILAYNPDLTDKEITLPKGRWNVYINGQSAGTEILGTLKGTASVSAQSALVLVQDTSIPGYMIALIVIAAIAAICVMIIVIKKEMTKNERRA